MPNKKNIEQLELLSEKFSKAKAIYFTEYHGLKVSEITELRSSFFDSGVEYLVAKNTILKLAAEKNKIEGLDDLFSGSTAIAISYDEPVSPAKVLKKFNKQNDLPSVKGILFDGNVLPGSDLEKLAKMIKSTSEFEGEIDNQIIMNEKIKKNTTMEVLEFLKKKK